MSGLRHIKTSRLTKSVNKHITLLSDANVPVGFRAQQRAKYSSVHVVIFMSEERNRNCWPLGIIEKLIVGRDGVVRAAKVRTRKTVLERAIQHLYPLELSCDRSKDADSQPYRAAIQAQTGCSGCNRVTHPRHC